MCHLAAGAAAAGGLGAAATEASISATKASAFAMVWRAAAALAAKVSTGAAAVVAAAASALATLFGAAGGEFGGDDFAKVGFAKGAFQPLDALEHEGFAEAFFDIAQHGQIGWGNERNGDAAGPCPAGAADAVGVILWKIWQIVVDDVADVFHIYPTGGDVGCYQHL